MKEITKILEELDKVKLVNEQTIIKVDDKIFNYLGQEIESDLFTKIKDKYSIFTYGEYSQKYSNIGKDLVSSTDDAAQMFGYKIRCIKQFPRTNAIVFNKGFVCVGKNMRNVIASAILIEKLCRIELLNGKIGKVSYLSKLLCAIEHLVFTKSYSKRADKNERIKD